MPTANELIHSRAASGPSWQPISFNAVASNFYAGQKIAAIARELILERGQSYALGNAPVSPTFNLTGNKQPELSQLLWLKGKNKCNQFVGDTLSYAGFAMPTFRMSDNSLHYAHAESLANFKNYFAPITQVTSLMPGDVLVLDWPQKRGENGAHVEVITAIDWRSGSLLAATARKAGASEKNYQGLLLNLSWDGAKNSWAKLNQQSGETTWIHLLRPVKLQS